MNIYMARFLAITIAGLFLLGAAHINGLTMMVVDADPSRITLGIGALFCVGWWMCLTRLIRLEPPPKYTVYREDTEAWLNSRLRPVNWIVEHLTFLGLVGTVIGFIMAMLGEHGELGTFEFDKQLVAQVFRGMGVALYTTLVGAIGAIWLGLLYLQLEGRATAVLLNR